MTISVGPGLVTKPYWIGLFFACAAPQFLYHLYVFNFIPCSELDVKAKTPTLGDSAGLSHVSEAGKNLSVTSVALHVGPFNLYPS